MLLLGGFAIAAALSKYGIAKMLATVVLSKAGTKPRTVLLTNMFVAMFASMWISNVAAPVLCFSIIQVILSPDLPRISMLIRLDLASVEEPAFGIQVFQSTHPGYCFSVQYWWYGLTDRESTEHHCFAEHATSP